MEKEVVVVDSGTGWWEGGREGAGIGGNRQKNEVRQSTGDKERSMARFSQHRTKGDDGGATRWKRQRHIDAGHTDQTYIKNQVDPSAPTTLHSEATKHPRNVRNDWICTVR